MESLTDLERKYKDQIFDWISTFVYNDEAIMKELDEMTCLTELGDGYILRILIGVIYPHLKSFPHLESRNANLILPDIIKQIYLRFKRTFDIDINITDAQIKEVLKTQNSQALKENILLIVITTPQQNINPQPQNMIGGGRFSYNSSQSQGPMMSNSRQECESGDYDQYSNGDAPGSGANNSGVLVQRHSYQNSQYSINKKSNYHDNDKQSIGSENEVFNIGQSPLNQRRTTNNIYASTSRHVKYQNRTGQLQQDEINAMINEIEMLQRENDDLKNQNQVANEDLNAYECDLDQLQLELDDLREYKEKYEENENTYKDMFQKKEKREILLIEKLKEMRNHKNKLQDKSSYVFQKAKSIIAEYSSFKAHIKDMQLIIQEQMSLKNQEFQFAISNFQEKQVKNFQKLIKEKQRDMEQQKTHYENKIARLQEQLDIYQNQNQSDNSINQNKELAKLQEIIQRTQKENDELQKQLELQKVQSQTDLDEKLQEIKTFNEQEITKKLKEQKDILTIALNNKLEKQKSNICNEMNEKHKQQLECEISKQKVEYENTIKTLTEELDDLKSDLALRIPIKDQARQTMRKSQPESQQTVGNEVEDQERIALIAKMQGEIDSLKNEIREKEAMLNQVQSEFEEYQIQSTKRLQQRKKEIDALKEENDKLKDELEKCVKHFQEQQLKTYKQRESIMSHLNNGSSLHQVQGHTNELSQSQTNTPIEHFKLRYNDENVNNRNSQLPLPFGRNTTQMPRTPNQLQSNTFQRKLDEKSNSNDGIVSCKSVYQSLSQQLQIDEKYNFSAFEREERVAPVNLTNRSHSDDEEHDDDDDQNLSFFLSNESSKHRDSRITGDEIMESLKVRKCSENILEQIEQDISKIDKVLEQNKINKVEGLQGFIKTQRTESDPLNSQVFIQGINDNYITDQASQTFTPQPQDSDYNTPTKGEEQKEDDSDLIQVDEELIKYLQEMIEMLNTDDEELNAQNKEMLIKQISSKLQSQKIKADRKQIEQFLDTLKDQQYSKAQTAEEKRKLLKKMTETFYTLGYTAFYAQSQTQCASAALQLGLQGGSIETLSNGLLSKTAWIAVAFVYTAQTGLNYRRYKKGNITKKEFWSRVKINSVTTVSSVAVGSGGAAAGFAIGTAMFPGIGSIIGSVMGGIIGGFAGEKLSAKAYKSIEHRIDQAKERKRLRELNEMQNLETSGTKYTAKSNKNDCRISQERYEQALSQLAIPSFKANMFEIEQSYMNMLEVLTNNKLMDQNKSPEIQEQFLMKYQLIIDSYEDIREYREYHNIIN
ncbi:UNKNOWN [Stylonychia lemnae]|uniref:Uncharacterized protein n=1 Tax=Stylonychia lemnae TaxID=5949 RepID=A0A077ZRH0_STYLE|nr:UNKNOWN [Stylonychia lemnae]|eukprot:CDW71096.1 UNKNOWN [Stylonychia lemnae]